MEDQTKKKIISWDVSELRAKLANIIPQTEKPPTTVKRKRGTKRVYNFDKMKRRRKIAKATRQKQRRRK